MNIRTRIKSGLLAGAFALTLSTAPVQAAPAAHGIPKPPLCKIHNGKPYCLPVNGGSGITPPVLKRKRLAMAVYGRNQRNRNRYQLRCLCWRANRLLAA